MHVLKRFYLIGSLAFAFVIPLITITQFVEPTYIEGFTSLAQSDHKVSTNDVVTAAPQVNYNSILWVIYSIGLLLLAFRFFKNLLQMVKKINANQLHRNNGVKYVLLKNHTIPHTFMNYVFLNKENYEALHIPDEVLLHEETHARQLHTLDILFVEVCQILLWFNPLIYLWKNMVRLNHEFLADSNVLQKGVSLQTYQTMLLDFTTNQSHLQFSNLISYHKFIKKRFIVMKTKHSRKEIRLKALMLVPLVAFMFYSFSNKEVFLNQQDLQEKASKELVEKYNQLASKYNELDNKDIFIVKHEVEQIKYIYGLMNEAQRANAVPFPKFPDHPLVPIAPKQPEVLKNAPSSPSSPTPPSSLTPPPPPSAPSGLTPPPPPSVDFKALSEKGAVFYLDGKEIEAKKALNFIENNEFSKIQIIDQDTNRPIVKLSTN
ncbi:M56 family metallopeptidase [Ascidiimonas sp. W6]|uniref:M56 family metallopeptidase n=1 Tax=Ascidiimonas meishanensis TaxID=3128903 RepID=UPI0030ED655D